MLFYTKTSVSQGKQRDPASCFMLSQLAEVIWYRLNYRDTLALKVVRDLKIRRRRRRKP